MTPADRVQAVVDYGFTRREARFLVLVMRHAGVCVRHQYAAFAGIANGGDRCNALFAKLVRRGFAVAVTCVHPRARLYHLHHKPLYHAIGEVHSRYRRTVPARAVVERLLRLDAALLTPEIEWLTTRSAKHAHLAAQTSAGTSEPHAPHLQDASDLLPGTFPIGIDHEGRAMVIYVATKPWTDDFRSFLAGHVPLLAAMRTWTLRLVLPSALRRVVADYQRAMHEELESRLDAQTINDLGWYFFHVRRRTNWSEYPSDSPVITRFGRCATVFSGARFMRLYRCWLTAREAALTPIPAAVSEALAVGRASLECVVSPHDYELFAPVVRGARRPGQRDAAEGTAGEEEGEDASRGINGSLNRLINGSHRPRYRPTDRSLRDRFADNAFCLQQLPIIAPSTDGAAFSAAPDTVPISAEAEPRT